MAIEISVLVPVCNEAPNLRPFYQELKGVLDGLTVGSEVIFIDDGSQDESPAILAELASQHSGVKVIVFRRNMGQTAAFDAGFSHASGQIIITMDSDLQNDPHDIPAMLKLIADGNDFVAGWRKNRKDGFWLRTFPSRIANWLIRVVTQTKIHDLGCSLKVYRREMSDELRLYGEMHRFIGVLIEGMGAKIAEIEVNHRPRNAGQSKYNLIRTFKVLLDLFTVWFMQGYRTKPSYVFGAMGGLLVVASVGISGFVLWQKLSMEIWVHRNPLFTVAVLFAVVGVQFLALGLLAELMVRTYFESSRQKPYLIHRMIGFPPAQKAESPGI